MTMLVERLPTLRHWCAPNASYVVVDMLESEHSTRPAFSSSSTSASASSCSSRFEAQLTLAVVIATSRNSVSRRPCGRLSTSQRTAFIGPGRLLQRAFEGQPTTTTTDDGFRLLSTSLATHHFILKLNRNHPADAGHVPAVAPFQCLLCYHFAATLMTVLLT